MLEYRRHRAGVVNTLRLVKSCIRKETVVGGDVECIDERIG